MQVAAGADGTEVLLRRADGLTRGDTAEQGEEHQGRQRRPSNPTRHGHFQWAGVYL
jgi:hypothetical protein